MKRTMADVRNQDGDQVADALLEFKLAAANIVELFTTRYQMPNRGMRLNMIDLAIQQLRVLERYDSGGAAS
ncbi:MAG: hypothetical protein ACRD5H_07280 [Nitrososphaerales archaeon]